MSVSESIDCIEPIRIAHVVGKMVGGGLEATVLNYYRCIDRSKIQYDFIVDNDSTLIPEEIAELGGRVILVPPYQKQLAYQRELYRIFKENNYKIVYSHMNTLSIFPMYVAWKAKIPVRIAHNHSTAGKGELKKNLIKYSLRPFAKIFPNTLCACSTFAGKWLFGQQAMNSGKITIWKNAVNINKFLYSSDTRKRIRKECGIENQFVVAHVGRFIHQKNHEFIVKIFEEIHIMKPETILLLVGSGDRIEEIKNMVSTLNLTDSVMFLGNRSDIADVYQAMDAFVMPSFYEGLGMVAVEAQIAGLPVVCADTIPIEAKISDNMKYLSLHDSVRTWANLVLSFSRGYERKNMKGCAEDLGYDINFAAQKMTKWYCELLDIK
ncbi:MAG: glycosyltransferase family 1 protein [Lachnospiraceae bacterium]